MVFPMLSFLKNINEFLWGMPMIIILLGTHLYFTFSLKFPQKYTRKAIKWSITPEKSNSSSSFSGFAALSTMLAATLGTGNIIGVSTAIFFGGPGAVFWCWITGILGMATSYAECYLSILFRQKDKENQYIGGPMYVLEHGLHKKHLAHFYAIATMVASFGVGCTTQANSLTETTSQLWNLSPYLVGLIASLVTGFVIIGGVKSIGKVCTKLVPLMGFFYIIGCFYLLLLNRTFVLQALHFIIRSAFLPNAIVGGVIGGTLQAAIRYGIARGLFTNEAGLGSAAIAAAATDTNQPSRQAFISMTATFWDTVVMCAITGLVVVTHILKYPSSIQTTSPAGLTTAAFSTIPYIGDGMIGISMIAFAIATLIGWSYFGEKSVEYLFGSKYIQPYQVCYLVMIFVGAIISMDLVWQLTDFINIFMAIPNIIALLLLRKKIHSDCDG